MTAAEWESHGSMPAEPPSWVPAEVRTAWRASHDMIQWAQDELPECHDCMAKCGGGTYQWPCFGFEHEREVRIPFRHQEDFEACMAGTASPIHPLLADAVSKTWALVPGVPASA